MSTDHAKVTTKNSHTPNLSISLLSVYFFSGCAALSYEILWSRMLSLQFGVSIVGVVLTVSGLMLGLGIGSYFGIKLVNKQKRLLQLFAFLELFIALFALASPFIIQFINGFLSDQAGALSLLQWHLMQGSCLLLVIMLPGLAMGAGFPLVLAIGKQMQLATGSVYGINVLGGALGALLPLWMLPELGWLSAMQVTAAASFVVATSAFLLSRICVFEAVNEIAKPNNQRGIPKGELISYAIIGMAAIMLEICWTRLYGMIMLRTEYVMAIILVIYLLGVGLGSVIATRLNVKMLNHLPWIVAIGGLLSLFGFIWLSGQLEVSRFSSLTHAVLIQALGLSLLTFPTTLVLGAWLPLLSQRFSADLNPGAIFYSVNSIGSGFGAMLAGFVFIPMLGSTYTLYFCILLIFAAGCYWVKDRRIYLVAMPLLICLLWAGFPQVSTLMPVTHARSKTLFLHEDSLSITHVLEREDGQRLLLSDLQRMDASTDPASVAVQQNQARLPLLLHPNPQRVLFLGLGTGISVSGSQDYPHLQRTAVELSEGAIIAAEKYFSSVNQNVSSNTKIFRDDAKRFLNADDEKYDVIIGDLFHPDLVGRSALLSVQQFQRAKRRLHSNGLFVQWIALNQFDQEGLQIVLRSFARVFPQAVIFIDAFRLALVGTNGNTLNAQMSIQNLSRFSPQQQAEVTDSESVMTWLGRYWGRILQSEGVVQDEWAPRLEFHLPKARYRGDLDLAALLEYLLSVRPDWQTALNELKIEPADAEVFRQAYLATEKAEQSWLASLKGDANASMTLMRQAYELNRLDRWIGFAFADQLMENQALMQSAGISEEKTLHAVLKVRPDHPEALKRLWQIAQTNGNEQEAEKYKNELMRISPLDLDVRQSE